MTGDLIAFLRARLDEDGEVASMIEDRGHWRGIHVDSATEVAVHIERHNPARVLREVEAKRRILAEHNVWAAVYPKHAHMADLDRHCVGCGFTGSEEYAVDDVDECPTLRALATVYADHEDYREEWRP